MRLIILFLILFISTPCFSVLPVIDAGQIIKTTEVIEQLKAQYQSLQSQYQQLLTQYQAITGHYGWGTFENSLTQLRQQREWTAVSWQQALQGIAGGNPSRYKQLLQQYKQNHQTLSLASYTKAKDKSLATAYNNQVETNQASATQANYEFNSINSHLKILYQLGQDIENAKQNNNLKSAMDLNSRIELEVAYISIEELRMETLLNEQSAAVQADRIAKETEAAKYNIVGKQS